MADRTGTQKSHRGFWVLLLVIMPLLSIIFGAYSGYLDANRLRPERTLAIFCNAVLTGNGQQAYSQYSGKYQLAYPEQQFVSSVTPGSITACSYSRISSTSNRATARLTLVYASGAANNDTVTLIQDSNNNWKIDAGVSLFTPDAILDTFCSALLGRNYTLAHEQFSTDYQRMYPRQQFVNDASTDQIIACSYDPVSVSGSSGLTQLRLVHTSRITNNDLVILSQDDGNTWKIASGIHFSTPLKTVTLFCNALQSENFPLAYAQLSDTFQSIVSEQSFASTFARNKVVSCNHTSLNMSGATPMATLKLENISNMVYSDVIILGQDGSNDWKIESIELL